MRDLAASYMVKPSEIFDCYWAVPGKTIEDLLWMSDKERRQIKLIYGHFFFGVHKLLDRPANYMTVFRDPVSRVISQYCFQHRGANGGIEIPTSALDHFKAIVRSGDFQYNNLAARMISGFGPSKRTDSELLETALKNIDKYFSFVGALEDPKLNRKIGRSFARFYNLPPGNIELGRKNVNNYKLPHLDDELIDLIESSNKVDLQLYLRYIGTSRESEYRANDRAV
ncbi:hypothetical protein [Methylobacterium sp. CM6246]